MNLDESIIALDTMPRKAKVLYIFKNYDEYMRAYAIANEYNLQNLNFYEMNTYKRIEQVYDDLVKHNKHAAILHRRSFVFSHKFIGEVFIINRA